MDGDGDGSRVDPACWVLVGELDSGWMGWFSAAEEVVVGKMPPALVLFPLFGIRNFCPRDEIFALVLAALLVGDRSNN